ncbi:peptidoglycan-N-acetylmuramate O-acetyltransferase [Austwickia chelonae]|uniref:Putative acyltransferase n=1 Tax=Austwickia chelonae NBRC 105200 TaxID=1184607 RepID=K6VK63_9MICO|nr:acyltransferase family protein [Austwickia chelonae]GAB77104.1 putative acyltransferase [Austwickia chelonae NBRC 105200]SEW02879.1 peptidoglycan-N-acetylmuramate O-acetyltransferase [Austwickia chelonae]
MRTGIVGSEVETRTRTRRDKKAHYLTGLDGVRAFAVLAVLAYHFHVPFSTGGFLGVDIFFVLSGYLISSQLWSRWAVQGPDLKMFWLARMRRLFPAVFALILACTVAMLIGGRDQLGVFFGDVGAAATYTSNWWYIFHQRSYFEASGRPPVLQHLWSLAVEEQFYVVWPLLVLLVLNNIPRQRARRQVLTIVSLTLAVISSLIMGFGSAMSKVPDAGDPSRWYFGTDSHAIGLLLGAALAFHRGGAGFGSLMPTIRPATRVHTGIGVFCLGLLVSAVTLIDEFSVPLYRFGFPIISVITVFLVAVVSRPGILEEVFSIPLLRYIGQRSYGLYLWHWPVAAFTRPDLDLPFTGARVMVLRFVLTFVLAELSYQLIEQPVRLHGWRNPWRNMRWTFPVFRLSVIQLVAGMAVAFAIPARVDVPQPQLPTAVAPSTPTPSKPTPSLSPEQVTPRLDLSLVVYGDSVPAGAQSALQKFFGKVDNRAKVAEHSWKLLPELSADAAAGKIRADVLVIHTGDNGIIPDAELKRALDSVKHIRSVIVVTPKVPRSWERRAIQSIRSITPGYANATIADWHTYAQNKPSWFVSDGIHLAEPGKEAYTRLILSQVAIPDSEGSLPKPTPTTSSPTPSATGTSRPPGGPGRPGSPARPTTRQPARTSTTTPS